MLVGKIKDVFDGKIEAYDKNGNVVKPGEITDPRSWLKPIADADENILRVNYEDTGDWAFIEVMGLVSNTVADHVAYLTKVFGSSGLAKEVYTDGSW